MPRFSVTSVALLSPVILIGLFSFELPLRYSVDRHLGRDRAHLLEAGARPVGVAVAEVDEES
jgi:hypothetical protein